MPENSPVGRTFTRVPRWADPEATDSPEATDGPDVDVHHLPLAGHVDEDLRRFARDAGVDERCVLLAAHLKVLSVVTAEAVVVTRYLPGAVGGPVPFRFEVCPGTWRELVDGVATAHRRTLARRPEHETGTDVVLDLSGMGQAAPPETGGQTLDPDVVLRVDYSGGVLRVGTRSSLVDPRAARRLAGYHRTALRLLVADPDAPHHEQSLLSDEEVHFQVHGLAGERTEAPAGFLPELFEERVRRHPDRTAAVHDGVTLDYAELNRRANRIAHALLDRGVAAEDPVAVVMHRNLDWLAATLGVLKAGGVYLPVRPDFPADRIATQLTRSGCRLIIAEAGATGTLDRAVAGLDGADAQRGPLLVDEILREAGRDDDPGVPIGPGQLAYIYFTSGSTGTPKGAMCEHAGMMNHLYAKIDDLHMTEDDVVAQTASQCFDISLWQLVAPLIVGAAVRIVDTDVQLDVPRFVDEIVEGGVSVAQLVPSYLDVLLTHLERHPRSFGRLHSVSVTGEALKMEPVQRWLALYPEIPLVNAYGATELSDDTMHEVLDRVPPRGFVSVGRSLRNVNTYIVDENLRLVPLGSPGEITFSGVAVGRGYINDEERTREAFVSDPHRPGTRMYRTGDFGRWLPEGKIQFLGRRDQQVKIRGFRIEIGEIENVLAAMPGVGDVAVVVDDGAGGGPRHDSRLVAFYSGPASVPGEQLRDFVAAAVPSYMVPGHFHWVEELPHSENGKVDKKVLKRLAGTLGQAGTAQAAPRTNTERRLATAWAEALNVPLERLGRDDSFFDLGGTSLAAVRLVMRLDRLLSLKDIVRHPTLAELAAVLDIRAGAPAPTPGRPARSHAELLQPLTSTGPAAVATLVCFPYAGGNAVNFHLMAKELERDGIAVYGLELPGHDFIQGDDPLADVAEIARAAHAEIRERISTPVMLWGHCAGAAHALATARLLEAESAAPHRVFLAALMLDDVDRLRAEIDEVMARDNDEITVRQLADSAYVELDELKAERTELVGTAYRHDVRSTNTFLIKARRDPASSRIAAAVDVVVTADDPTTAGHRRRHRAWELLTGGTRLHELDEGGHYFVRTRARACAALVVDACAGLERSGSEPAPADG